MIQPIFFTSIKSLSLSWATTFCNANIVTRVKNSGSIMHSTPELAGERCAGTASLVERLVKRRVMFSSAGIGLTEQNSQIVLDQLLSIVDLRKMDIDPHPFLHKMCIHVLLLSSSFSSLQLKYMLTSL